MLKQSVIITSKVISNKIPSSIWITFITLLLVYISFYTVNGISNYLTFKLVTPWLKDRTHFIFSTHNCDVQTTEAIAASLQWTGYKSTLVCSKAAKVTALRKFPGEPRLSAVIAVEYQPEYLRQIRFKSSSYEDDIKTYIGSCLEELGGDPLLNGKLSSPELTSTQCDWDDKPLPVIAIGKKLAHSLSNGPGTIPSGVTIDLYEQISLTDFSEETSGETFVIASIFETGFEDLDNAILGPIGFLSSLVQSTNIEHNVHVKIQNVESIENLREVFNLIQEDDNLYHYLKYSITDDEVWEVQDLTLNTIAVMTWIVHLLVYLVLLGGLSQFIETNRKLLALMRISGIGLSSIWLFLLFITLASVSLICVLSYFLSLIVSDILVNFIEHIDYIINFNVLSDTLITSVFVAFFITIALKKIHFSGDLAKELEHARRNS